MNINSKKQLVDAIAIEAVGVSKADIQQVLDSLSSVAAKALKAEKEVILPGIGKLKPAFRAARAGRNPQTGETIQIAAKRGAKLSLIKSFADHINY